MTKQRHFCEWISREGAQPVDAVMAWALLHPEHGYYHQTEVFGGRGDFVTAPEISQMFGEMVGIWVAEAWHAMGRPERWQLCEFGPGRGSMMRDVVRSLVALARSLPGVMDGCSIHLVEASPTRMAEQRQNLAGLAMPVYWQSHAPNFDQPTILLANEFLDALPIQQWQLVEGEWHERVVVLGADGKPVFATRKGGDVPEHLLGLKPSEGTIAEYCPLAHQHIAMVAEASRHVPLAALYVDYGYVHGGLGDSLQAVKAHRYVDVLASLGEADLTAHVDFLRLANTAQQHGAMVEPLLTQREFLMRMGIVARVEKLIKKNPDAGHRLAGELHRLVDVEAMGELFKVMIVRTNT